MKLTFIAALELSGTPSLYFPVINPQASGDQVIAPTPERIKSESVKPKRALRLSHLSEHCGWLTDLVVEFRKLHLNFIPLEIVIFCLFTHRWYQVKLACNRVRLLVPKRGKQTVADELFLCQKLQKISKSELSSSPWSPWHSSVTFPNTSPSLGLLQTSWLGRFLENKYHIVTYYSKIDQFKQIMDIWNLN